MPPNRRLRQARQAAGLSQGRLAENANARVLDVTGRPGALDSNTVSRLERGAITRPSRRYLEALCWVLGASADELGFGVDAISAPIIAARAKPRKVSREAIDALATILAGLRRLEDTAGSALVAPTVEYHVGLAEDFAREAKSADRQRAISLVAELSTYRGWLAVDLRQWTVARRFLNDAVTLSLEARAMDLAVEAMGFRSYAALRYGDFAEAVSLRYAAQPLAKTSVEQAIASLHLARTLAVAGDIPESDHALADADRAIERASGQPRDDYHYYVTDAWLLVQHGLVHAWAGRRTDAAREIAAGLAEMPPEQRDSSWGVEYRRMLDKLC